MGEHNQVCKWYKKSQISLSLHVAFEEKQGEFLTDSPTCSKEGLRLILCLLSSKKWKCQSIDIKAAFLQRRPFDRDVYLVTPKDAGVDINSV